MESKIVTIEATNPLIAHVIIQILFSPSPFWTTYFFFDLACNLTYYGEVGHTYELEVKRPNDNQIPFLCFLNFTAGGGLLGDLVQV